MILRCSFSRVFLFLAFFGVTTYTRAASSDTSKNTEVSPDSVMKNKLFYFFEVLNSETKIKQLIEENELLKEIYTEQITRTTSSQQRCNSGRCYAEALCWTDREIEKAGTALISILEKNEKRQSIIKNLKESRHYNLFHDLNDTAFIRTVWEYNAQGINRIFRIYLGGNPPKRYAAIDSISCKQDDPRFVQRVDSIMTAVTTPFKDRSSLSFFELSLKIAPAILNINGRDEVARYEPLTAGYNSEAFMAVKNIDWSLYKYSVLLVPGFGPEKEGVRIHEKGITRCKMAAERFKSGLAPLIIVSGGHVYPFRTPFSEAVEMRRYLIEELDIPKEAVIIEPHARHTTTNIRNATRLLYRFDIPDTLPGLVVTDAAQVNMIKNLASRCIRELGYVPYKNVNVLNENEVEFTPSTQALQINLEDVLDP